MNLWEKEYPGGMVPFDQVSAERVKSCGWSFPMWCSAWIPGVNVRPGSVGRSRVDGCSEIGWGLFPPREGVTPPSPPGLHRMTTVARFSLSGALSQLPPVPMAHALEQAAWWRLDGLPALVPLRAVRTRDQIVADLDRLLTRLEWLALLASITKETVETGVVPVDRLELLRSRVEQSTAVAGGQVAATLPADYDAALVARCLWGHGPWKHWDVALETASLAGRSLRIDGRFRKDVSAVVWGLLLRDVAWEVISLRPHSPGRERLIPAHPAMGAALVQGTPSLPHLVSQVIADHHRFGRAMGAAVREGLLRRSNLSIAAAALTRLIDVESALVRSGKPGAIIRRVALEHLHREALQGTWDHEWVGDLASLLAGSSSRERVVPEVVPHDVTRGETFSIHPAEATPPAPHTGSPAGSHLAVTGLAQRRLHRDERPEEQRLASAPEEGR
jgi:hypothetical protein